MAVTLHQLTKTEHVVALLFYGTVISGMLSVIPCMHSWEPVSFSVLFIYIAPISIFGLIQQYAVTRAYAIAAPHVVGSLLYLCILFSTVLGWLFWNESLDAMKILSGLLLIGCGVMMVRENSIHKSSAKESADTAADFP